MSLAAACLNAPSLVIEFCCHNPRRHVLQPVHPGEEGAAGQDLARGAPRQEAHQEPDLPDRHQGVRRCASPSSFRTRALRACVDAAAVPRAESIMAPAIPIALRLSGHLLLGVWCASPHPPAPRPALPNRAGAVAPPGARTCGKARQPLLRERARGSHPGGGRQPHLLAQGVLPLQREQRGDGQDEDGAPNKSFSNLPVVLSPRAGCC